MSTLRHTLTQLACALLVGAASACDSNDADEKFTLCDGSDEIRLGYQSGGGFVDEGYGFEQPYGFQFLFIDGHCDFILAKHDEDTPGRFVHGHLSEDAAAELTQRLELARLPTGVYFDTESCPDAGSISLATPYFYGDCTCGCDKSAPTALEQALSSMSDALTQLHTVGAAASGDVELAAKRDSSSESDAALVWPFDWPVADIDNDQLNDATGAAKLRALQGAEAQAARNLFAQARMNDADKPVYVQSEGAVYRLFMRDRIDTPLKQRIAQFLLSSDPRKLRPIAACSGDPTQTASFGSALIDRQRLFAWIESQPQCGMRICWDGEFQEKQPVVAPLRVVRAATPRPCLGTPQTSFQLDLAPIIDAFRAGYPSAEVEIELSLPGFSGEILKLTE